MQNKNIELEKFLYSHTKSFRDYILLIRTNLVSFIIIIFIIFTISLIYALYAPINYSSTVTLKITKGHQTVLNTDRVPEENSLNNDRFIENEIEVIENYDTREKVAGALIDTFENAKDKSIFSLLSLKKNENGINGHKSIADISEILMTQVKTEQKSGTDIVNISANSPSPIEAALIVNTYEDQYSKLNLTENRNQLNTVRRFLENQRQDKLAELNNAENELADFKMKGGIVALDAQSTVLITQLSQLDAQRDAAKIDLMTSNVTLDQYKKELSNQDPYLANYLENQTSQAYIDVLQKQIAELQMNKDMAMTNKSPLDISVKIKDYDKKIDDLKQKLTSKINDIKTGTFSSSPEQIKGVAQKVIDEEIKNHALSIKLPELQSIISKYEGNVRKLPKKSMEFAGYERNMESLQQLYTLVEKKYQEAMINELSQPGNCIVISAGRVPVRPSKPNRLMIILIGCLIGPFIAFGFIIIKDNFDDTVKTPDDVEENDIRLLSWVPHSTMKLNKHYNNEELLSLYESDLPLRESFRTIKSRIQHSHSVSEFPQIILITSPAADEGKTFVSLNLAGNFAQSNKKTLLIDCDLRRPKLHSIMGVDKKPGLTEYFLHKAKLEDIIRNNNNFYYITAGSISSNPISFLESQIMTDFLKEIRNYFDVIIIDSAPIVAVIDTEILAKLVDGTILVISADKTKNQLMMDAVDIIKRNKIPFLGSILNNFRSKSGYSYYNKYYYNYSSNEKGNKNK